MSKAYEFVDTLIMVAKKNKRQISFLHVYHHATTFFPVWWAVVKYGPGGEAWFCCFLNSLVHVFVSTQTAHSPSKAYTRAKIGSCSPTPNPTHPCCDNHRCTDTTSARRSG